MLIRRRAKVAEQSAPDEDMAKRAATTPCPGCGKAVDDGAAFCQHCGRKLASGGKGKKSQAGAWSKREMKREMKRLSAKPAITSANDLAGFERMYKDGLCESAPGVFSRTMAFTDVAYEHERQDVKDDIYYKFSLLHSLFPVGSCYQLNLLNLPNKSYDIDRYLPEEGPQKEHAVAYNDILEERQRKGRTEFDRLNYITFSIPAADDDEASRILRATFENVIGHLARLNSRAEALDGDARLRLLHKLVRGAHEPYSFDYSLIERSRTTRARDYIAPGYAAYTGDAAIQRHTLTMPGRLVRSYHIRDFGSDLSDNAIRSIRALPIPMNISLLFRPQPTGEIVKKINLNIATVHAEIQAYEKSLSKEGASIAHLPPSMENREADSVELLDFIRDKEQHISWFQGIITVFADNEEQMQVYDKMINDERGKWSLDIQMMPLQQEEAFISALPLATPRLDRRYRSLATAECAAMVPFNSQNIHDDPMSSYLLGVDTVSGDTILVDPDKTKSPHMWVFGITGGGKGMAMNSIVEYLQLQHPRTEYDEAKKKHVCPDKRAPQMHIIDHHGEYVNVGQYYEGTVERFGPGHGSCLNLLNLSDATGELTMKTVMRNADFFIALVTSVLGRPLSKPETRVIEKTLRDVYEPYIGKRERPNLADFHEALRAQTESKDAEVLAEALHLYVEGSFSAFAGDTSFETDPQLNVYDVSEVGNQMQVLALLAILQHVRNCVFENHKVGRPTILIVEECQIIFDIEELINILDSFFGELRKYGLKMICVTQLPSRVIEHPRAAYLFENSSIFLLLPQQDQNADRLAEMFKLSQTQKQRISSKAQAGTGIVIADGVVISMENRINKDNLLYSVWNTDPYKLVEQADGEKAE